MVQLGEEADHLLILQVSLLQLLHRLGDLDVVHLETLVLLVARLLLLKLLHEEVLLLEEHLLTSPIQQRGVDLLGQGQDVVEG